VACLRNLAVCRPIRPLVLTSGVDKLAAQLFLDLKSNRDIGVAFKLVGLLRLLVQDNTELCHRLATWSELMVELVTVSTTIDLQGHLRIEVGRLLSSLVRYGKSAEVNGSVIRTGGLPCLVLLLSSPHVQLQNEAMVALAVLTGPRPPDRCLVEQLDVEVLVARLVELFIGNMPEEVKWNAIVVVSNLLSWSLTEVSEKFQAATQALRPALTSLMESLTCTDRKCIVKSVLDHLGKADEKS
jgi:hypothetical protein